MIIKWEDNNQTTTKEREREKVKRKEGRKHNKQALHFVFVFFFLRQNHHPFERPNLALSLTYLPTLELDTLKLT